MAVLVTVICAGSVVAAGAASADVLASHPRSVPAAGGSADDWPTVHRTGTLQGWASNSTVTTANAAQLGVKWAGGMYGAAVDSPVEAYDATLGERLAYIGTQNGDVMAMNMANGKIVWSQYVGNQVRSAPVVANGGVFIATANSTKVFKLDATTGAIDCTFVTPRQIEGDPVAATPPGGVPSVYFGSNDTNSASGPTYALNQSNCKEQWAFTDYRTNTAGSWGPLAYGTDANGTPLVIYGTADPDSTVYAVNAVTGKLVWKYYTAPPPGDFDIGAGVVIAEPGSTAGGTDGMAFVEGKIGIMYAMDLTTGKLVWSVHYTKEIGALGRNISTAALSGGNLVLGDAKGLVDLNPANGNVIWHNSDPASAGIDGSPAIAGPAGSQVVAIGDLAGGFEVDSLATGKLLYHYQCAQYITGSPAVSGGDILESSADGFLYDFAVGGGNETTLPANTVTSPVDSSQIKNPNGNLTVTGTAADKAGISGVVVAVQASGAQGPWWDAATGKWVPGPIDNPATVASPGGTSSTWSLSFPVPASGDTYQVTSYTVSTAGQSSVVTGGSGFIVLPSATAPQVKTSTVNVAPAGTLTVSGSGFGDSEKVDIDLDGTQVATATTDASGNVPSTKLTIPAEQAFGLTSLTLTGQTSGDAATAGITINNNWPEAGQNPDRTGYEPNDHVVFNSIAAGNGTYMNLAWAFSAPAAISAAPAVANTVAYVPAANGDLIALDTHFGTALWTWSGASGASLNAPAVDIAQGLVFVGSANGTLYAVSTSSGKTVWSDSIGGQVFAPVYSNGRLYVSTGNGTVEAVNEATGNKLWSKTLANPASAGPSLDTATKTLVVGESSGQVAALSSQDGSSIWTDSTDGAAVTMPGAIDDGLVYLGAGDSVYAINEKTGVIKWSYKTGGTISNSLTRNSTGATKGVVITVGSADGTLYALSAPTGKLVWKIPMGGGPITGVSSAYETYIFNTSKGAIGAGRDTSGLRDWYRKTSAGAFTSPVVVDGTIYAGGSDTDLYAYTTDGQPPA